MGVGASSGFRDVGLGGGFRVTVFALQTFGMSRLSDSSSSGVSGNSGTRKLLRCPYRSPSELQFPI